MKSTVQNGVFRNWIRKKRIFVRIQFHFFRFTTVCGRNRAVGAPAGEAMGAPAGEAEEDPAACFSEKIAEHPPNPLLCEKSWVLLSRVCAFPAQTVRKRIGRKHPAHRETIGMAGCRYHSAEG